MRQIDLLPPTDSAVHILGESGTWKELVAREIHHRSRRAGRPLISAPSGTAQLLGIKPTTLAARIKALGGLQNPLSSLH